MSTFGRVFRRDIFTDGDDFSGPPPIVFVGLLVLFSCVVAALLFFRRRRRAALNAALLPTHQPRGHHRTLTITTHPATLRGESIFVYDEKMNLIANSSSPPNSPVPEIRVTFPDEESKSGEAPKAGRVVVLRISETGSVGMEPLRTEELPPYQKSDAERFQSLDLERIGGLKEKEFVNGQRWS